MEQQILGIVDGNCSDQCKVRRPTILLRFMHVFLIISQNVCLTLPQLASIRALLLARLPSSTQPVALVAGVAGGKRTLPAATCVYSRAGVGSAVRARFLAGGWTVFGVDMRHNEVGLQRFIPCEIVTLCRNSRATL